jgi:hypothetical protein
MSDPALISKYFSLNPDGSTARAWVKSFPVRIKNGVLHGELGTRGAPDWYSLDGKIEADGSAILRTTGITVKAEYTASTTHPRSSVPYEYQVIAHFDDRHGTGKSAIPSVSVSLPSLKIEFPHCAYRSSQHCDAVASGHVGRVVSLPRRGQGRRHT